jgi:hypothetical protein
MDGWAMMGAAHAAKAFLRAFAPLSDLAEDGERIIGRIAFWREVPLLGRFVVSHLANQLDDLTDLIERAVMRRCTDTAIHRSYGTLAAYQQNAAAAGLLQSGASQQGIGSYLGSLGNLGRIL